MKRIIPILTRVVAPLVVLALALGAATQLVRSKPKAERAERALSAPLVEVIVASLESQTLQINATGTMRPAQLLVVQPQVSGAIIDHHPSMVPGGLIDEGEILLTIDARDYELAIERQRAQVARARLDLRVENGRQAIAEQEWDSMASELVMLDSADESLAKREPQVEAARAGVQAARGALETAQLSLDRTRIIAPFNAVVREEAVELGQVVGPGYRLATLVGTDLAWVEVSVSVSALANLAIPGHNVAEDEEGSSATIEQKMASGASIKREGKVIRLLRELDPRGRMARLIVQVEDPMELSLEAEERQLPLLTGAFVAVRIEGKELGDVVALPREALRDGRYAWVSTADNTLAIREVKVAWREREHVLITEGLFEGDNVIVSPLAAPVEGMSLRVAERGATEGASAEASEDASDADALGADADDAEGEASTSEAIGPDVEDAP